MKQSVTIIKQGSNQLGAKSNAVHQQQKRLQARRQKSRGTYNPEESKSRGKTYVPPDQNEEVKATKLAVRQNLDFAQFDSRQEHLVAHSEQTTFFANQRRESKQNSASGTCLQKIGGYRNSREQLISQTSASVNQSMKSQVQAATGPQNNNMQKKPEKVIAENKVTNKRQARTTHHSRQISLNGDQNSDIIAGVGFKKRTVITTGQNSSQGTDQPSQGSINQVTAAQKAHQSHKSKTTQSILKRLKHNINVNQMPSGGAISGSATSGQTSSLPSQISDAYSTTFTKKANSAAATMQGPVNASINTKLSTILEKNSNQKIVKTFIQPVSDAQLVGKLHKQQKEKGRTSSQINTNGTIPAESLNTVQTDGFSNNSMQQQQKRKPRSKDSALQQRQHRQSASPQNSQPINLISSVRNSLDDNLQKGTMGIASRGQQYQTVRQSTNSKVAGVINHPYSVQEHSQALQDANRYQTVFVNKKEGGIKQEKLTQAQMDVLKASFKNIGGDASITGHMVVKKANIVSDSNTSARQNPNQQAQKKNVQTKKTLYLQGRSSQARVAENMNNREAGPPFTVAMTTAVQKARHSSGPTSQTRSKNQVDVVSSGDSLHVNEQVKQTIFETYIKAQKKGAAPNKTNIASISFPMPKKQLQGGNLAPNKPTTIADTRVPPRKAKTAYARTPASFRSASGGKPQAQGANASSIASQVQQPQIVQQIISKNAGGLSMTQTNSPELYMKNCSQMNQKQQGIIVQQKKIHQPSSRYNQSQTFTQQLQTHNKNATKLSQESTRQSYQPRDQHSIFQQQQQSQPYSGAQSFGSLSQKHQTKFQVRSSSNAMTGKLITEHKVNNKGTSKASRSKVTNDPGLNKRSISFKGNKDAYSLGKQNPSNAQNESSPIHIKDGNNYTVNQKFSVNFEHDHLFNINKNQLISGTGQPNTHQSLVSPLRTKQPSINNSRKISREREFPKTQSLSSATSPRQSVLQNSQATKGSVYAPAQGQNSQQNQSRQHSTFLTNANHKSFGSNAIVNSKEQPTQKTKDMQKILKKFIKEAKKFQNNQQQDDTDNKQSLNNNRISSSKANQKPASITSHSSKGKKHHNAYKNKVNMAPVLEGAPSPSEDVDNEDFQSHLNNENTLNMMQQQIAERTFQQIRDQESQTFQNIPQQHASMGKFAPEMVKQKKQISAFMEHDIISGTYIATKSNEKLNSYPEEMKERLRSLVPSRMRISRVPTSQHLQANTFENQVTIKPGDQIQKLSVMQQSDQIEQISILDNSFDKLDSVVHTISSAKGSNKGIFQAFNEYVNQQDAISGCSLPIKQKKERINPVNETAKNKVNQQKNTHNITTSSPIDTLTKNEHMAEAKPCTKRAKQFEKDFMIKDFNQGDVQPQPSSARGGPVIDFHPSQPMIGEVSTPPGQTDLDTYKSAANDQKSQKKQTDPKQKAALSQSEYASDSDYDEELYQVHDPLLEDKQYLVTMIVTYFQKMGRPMATTAEFYRIGNQLGEGAFGKVVIAQHKLSGQFVAIKCMRKRDMQKQAECKKKVAQDLQILQHLTHHRNVVKLYDSFYTTNHLCFVMELCAGGDLLSFVRRRKKLDETMAKFIFFQVAKGLAYCHRHLVMHRDIKLENLLLDEEGTVKLCDFGVSQHLSSPDDLVKDQCGTPAYMAPEVYANSSEFSGQQADVWSLGVCLYAMLVGMVPFKGRGLNELRDAIMNQPLQYPDNEVKKSLSREASHLIKIMLRKNPKKRATVSQVLHHPWLKDSPSHMAIFSSSELKKIKTMSNPCFGGDEPQRLLTEVNLTDRSLTESEKKRRKEEGSQYELDYGMKSENISQKSNVLAPFNSTITNEDFQAYFCMDIPIKDAKIIKFSDKVREVNRQYEFNYNDEVDNGIMISLNNTLKQTEVQKEEKQDAKPQASKARTDNKQGKQLPNNKLVSSPATNKNAKLLIQKKKEDPKPPVMNQQLASQGSDDSGEIKIENARHVINFNGVQQVGYSISMKKEIPNPDAPPCSASKSNKDAKGTRAPKGTQKSADSSQSEEDADISQLIEKHMSFDIEEDDEDQIDNIVVCKIENEFGYPEEYLLECLKQNIKNDATTCYHMFCKEDKHEQVHLIQYTPHRPKQQKQMQQKQKKL